MLSMYETDEAAGSSTGTIRITGGSFAAIDRYKDVVYRTALTATGNHADAEDVMQEVFLRYFQTHPTFASDTHEKAWFIRVALNQSHNITRSVWFRRRTDADLTKIPQPEEGQTDSAVLRAVLALPERYRVAVYLYYYEAYPTKEIARLMGKSEAAVAQYLSRGRAKLRRKLGGAGHESS